MDQMECHYQMQVQAEKERAEAQERADAAAKAARDAQQQATAAAAAARDAEAARVKEAEARSRRAQQAADKAQAAKREAEERLKRGIRPMEWPTQEEFNAVKQRYSYKPGKFYLAVAGIAGKSSLINALRGLGDKGPMAARTGVTETTAEVQAYPDPDDSLPFVWFDVPGAGTLSVPDWTYFNNLGLYIFDAMIILFDNRFTDTGVAIIQNCVRFRNPFYTFRSKSDQHIQNLVKADMEDDSDDDGLTSQPSQADIARAKPRYETETRKIVRQNLLKAGLPEKSELHLVSRQCLRLIVTARQTRKPIKSAFVPDEQRLLQDLMLDALARRSPRSYQSISGQTKESVQRLIGQRLTADQGWLQ